MASNESAVLFDQPGPKSRKTIRIVNWIAGIAFAIVVVLILMRLHNPPDGCSAAAPAPHGVFP